MLSSVHGAVDRVVGGEDGSIVDTVVGGEDIS